MKRPPRPGEMALRHSTQQTGDVQTFAICAENYNPDAVVKVRSMEHEAVMGYRLNILSRDFFGVRFQIIRDRNGDILSVNQADRTEERMVTLHTTLVDMQPDEAALVADLEQCAALALLGMNSFS